jgi:hypothetical protein
MAVSFHGRAVPADNDDDEVVLAAKYAARWNKMQVHESLNLP